MAKRILYLVRHGQYRSDGPLASEALTALGRRQADRLGRRLREVGIQVVHHSNMPRARETALRIVDQLPPLPLRSTRLLREGIPNIAPHFAAPFRPPRSEQLATKARMDRAFERFFRPCRSERRELLVAHGNVIRYLVRRALGDTSHRWWQLEIQQCSLSIVEVSLERCALVSFNDVGHLPARMQTFV